MKECETDNTLLLQGGKFTRKVEFELLCVRKRTGEIFPPQGKMRTEDEESLRIRARPGKGDSGGRFTPRYYTVQQQEFMDRSEERGCELWS